MFDLQSGTPAGDDLGSVEATDPRYVGARPDGDEQGATLVDPHEESGPTPVITHRATTIDEERTQKTSEICSFRRRITRLRRFFARLRNL